MSVQVLPQFAILFFLSIFIPRQGDLFLYGTEALICPINRKGSWVGCLYGNEAKLVPFSFRAFCVLLFSDKNQIKMEPGVLKPLILIYFEKKWNLLEPSGKV